jgi:hypothetical protein
MASFAQRMGLRPVRTLIQRDSLDEDTRTELWNLTVSMFRAIVEKRGWNDQTSVYQHITSAIWAWELKKPRDEEPSENVVWAQVKSVILRSDWVDALDLIEAILGYAKRYEDHSTGGIAEGFAGLFNKTFEIYLVGFRFIDLKLMPLDSEVDLDSIASALENAKPFKGARHHLEQAATLLADRKNPDYPNSIKESISAVESVCIAVTGEKTLGAAVKKLQAAGVKIHPALEAAWSKMYGWTSDEDGIRHGSIEAPDADQTLAKYMLIICSAFVSHVIEMGRKAKLI